MRGSYQVWALMTVMVSAVLGPRSSSASSDRYYVPLSGTFVIPPSGSSGSGNGHFYFNAAEDTAFYVNLRYSGLGSASTSIDVHVGHLYETGPATVHISDGGSTSGV